ncbi:MAG: hypothetical protein K8R35_01215 [Bacteroidales bacterium]|nr:hypothetical protein [Bacteroidales bacterium]
MKNTKHICTYFDKNFLARGLALYDSIIQFHNDFIFYVLTFDSETYEYLSGMGYSNMILISNETYNEYFDTNPENFDDKKQYYFSSTPNICLYILENFQTVDLLLYLDADVYLFNSLDPVYQEVENASIAYCPHRTHNIFNMLAKNHGKYNVGVNFFRNNELARNCLNGWKSECENWYKGTPGYHLDYFSDQIFLDNWENNFPGTMVITNIGVNAAPWNAGRFRFQETNGVFFINDNPLIIFHFSSLKKINDNTWNCNSVIYFTSVSRILLKIYETYINKIESYNLNNSISEHVKLKNGTGKRIFLLLGRLFYNEIIKLRK